MKQVEITKAELARQLGVSRAYITMIASGKRKPSEDIVNKLNSLSFETNQIVNKIEANSLTLNQPVQGSSPWRLTSGYLCADLPPGVTVNVVSPTISVCFSLASDYRQFYDEGGSLS